jgi:hypothetical protein
MSRRLGVSLTVEAGKHGDATQQQDIMPKGYRFLLSEEGKERQYGED